MGSLLKVFGKDKDPKWGSIPFIMAVGGYSKYLSNSDLQYLKELSMTEGLTFHAMAFLRYPKRNDIYTETVREALGFLEKKAKTDKRYEKYSGSLKEFNTLQAKLVYDPKNFDKELNKEKLPNYVEKMSEFWQKYQSGPLNAQGEG